MTLVDVSVIVPVYNMAKNGNLNYCLDSLVNQTLESLEIIAVDDASTDNSLEIIRQYEAKYPGRVVGVASPENRRQGGARNLGLKHAQGRYIAFMDADDWADPNMYESMLKKALETGANVVGTDLCRVNEHTMVKTKREECNYEAQTGVTDDEKRRLLLLDPGPFVTKIYERSYFEDGFSFCEKMAYEDNAAIAEAIMRYRHFEMVPESNWYYYQNPESTTHSISKKSCEDRMAAMRYMLKTARENGAYDRFKDEIEYKFTNLFYQATLLSYMLSTLKKEYGFINALGKEMKETFPDFEKNKYYIERTNAEEKKLMHLQQRSTGLFLIYFLLKRTYRKIRYGRW